MEAEISIPASLMAPLLQRAAEQEVPVEDIVWEALQKCMERGESIADK